MLIPKYFLMDIPMAMNGRFRNAEDLNLSFKESPTRLAAGPVLLDVDGCVWEPVISTIGCDLVCQESLANEMTKHGIVIGRGERYPVSFEMVEGRARKQWPPAYVWLRPLRELVVEEFTPNVDWMRSSDPDLQWFPGIGSPPASDVFGAYDNTSRTYCNRRFVELARACGWDFFRFAPMDMPRKKRNGWKIDHLGGQWPPQWYPEGVEPHPSNLEEVGEIAAVLTAPLEVGASVVQTGEALSELELEQLAEAEGKEPTGYSILGERVYWFNYEGLSEQRFKKLQKVVAPYLAEALPVAEQQLLGMAAKEGMTPEISAICIGLDVDKPLGCWSLEVEGYIDGPTPHYGLDFQGSKLVEITGVD